jgi:ATP-binding protein involved in chromosome partitioning
MTQITEEQILDTLKGIIDPDKGADIVGLGMVSSIRIKDGHVAFAIEVEPERGSRLEPLRKEAEKAVHALAGVISATVVLTAERAGPAGGNGGAPQGGPGGGAAAMENLMPETKAIIAVASGKGGVGKSTIAINLALALAAKGQKIGLLDADIYGPSIPRMMGLSGEPQSSDGRTLDPMANHGVKCMSMGFLVEEETPVIWRGPMVQSALQQMMRDVNWGELDVLVVDMPPGTGDAQLTMAQQVPLAGAIIVSTPQDIALADARKGLNMFRKVDVPVFGIIENMSYFSCPHCGERTEIFSHGGARDEAELLSTDFLGEIPLDQEIRETSDSGNPIVVSNPGSAHAKAFQDIADKVAAKIAEVLEKRRSTTPKIVIQ